MNSAVDKEVIWQRFRSRVEEIEKLLKTLAELDAQRQQLLTQIEQQKGFLQEICGVSWDELRSTLGPSQDARIPDVSPATQTNQRKPAIIKGSVPYWVLCAISHYESANKSSRVDSRSIKAFINKQNPNMLKDRPKDVIFPALTDLSRRNMIVRSHSRVGRNKRSQYRLTDLGREVLQTHSKGE